METDTVRPKGYNEGEDSASTKAVSLPCRPSQEEWLDHRLTHTPYRSWCSYCVKARGRQDAAKKTDGKEERRGVPQALMDYAYLNDAECEDKRPLLVIQDHASGKKIGVQVPQKGDDPKAIALACKELRRLGHGRMILKSDQEPNILALKEKIRTDMGGSFAISMEESPVYSHKSNGEMEQAVGKLKGLVKTMKLALEGKSGRRVIDGEDVVPWMIAHASDVLTAIT